MEKETHTGETAPTESLSTPGDAPESLPATPEPEQTAAQAAAPPAYEEPHYYDMLPEEVPIYQAAINIQTSLRACYGEDVKLLFLMRQLEQTLDFDETGSSTTAESMLSLQIRVMDSLFNQCVKETTANGKVDTDMLRLALQTQKQCATTGETINRRRARDLAEKKFDKKNWEKEIKRNDELEKRKRKQ